MWNISILSNNAIEWTANIEQFKIKSGTLKLEVVHERGNVYDPYAFNGFTRVKTRKAIDGHHVIGHLP